MSKNSMNVKILREQFPIFKQQVNGYPFIYFDSAATAQVPEEVVTAMSQYYLTYKANIGRGIYTYAEQATYAYEQARKKIAHFIGAESAQILLTSGATESINIVALSWAQHYLQHGDEILISAIEHNSNVVPWIELASRIGCIVKRIAVDKDGIINLDDLEKKLSKKTKLVSIVHTSNTLGSTNNVKKITSMAHGVGAVVLVDASQSIAHQTIDVQNIDCDFLVFSGHKLFGPTGIGVLYTKHAMLSQMRPSCFGGGMVLSLDNDQALYKPYPQGFEAGTPNVAGAIGLAQAIEFVEKNINFDDLAKHETVLVHRLLLGLQSITDIEVLSIAPKSDQSHVHVVTFVHPKYHAHDIAAYLNNYGIAVRAGNHCVHTAAYVPSVRISFAAYNTLQEVDFCIQILQKLLL